MLNIQNTNEKIQSGELLSIKFYRHSIKKEPYQDTEIKYILSIQSSLKNSFNLFESKAKILEDSYFLKEWVKKLLFSEEGNVYPISDEYRLQSDKYYEIEEREQIKDKENHIFATAYVIKVTIPNFE